MQIGIGLPNQVRDVRASALPPWAARAEEAGFSTLATTGRYAYPGVSDTVALAAAAGATTTIGLLSAVLLAPTWPGALLAKEIAGIDGVSGARLTLGVGVGSREDEFTVPGHGMHGRGARLESDLATYREIWSGAPAGNGPNPAVPSGTRHVPMLFGGYSARALDRMVRWGEGYIGGSLPPAMTAPSFEAAKRAWRQAGRQGAPKLVVLTCFALGDPEAGRANIEDFYRLAPKDIAANAVLRTTRETIERSIKEYTDLGVDEIIFVPATDDLDEVTRLADIAT
ncbi:LLM class flavin-dependent oxidoreductase [Streptomyces sp. MST-110588]|uniref:LLM class flavin-dependent oxidoreductase n=1 Tax=Streptomyces sp. MST-110588 TaxID=2833628 RepID=UPI001F5DAC4B|nr:LLM class flavin-dependent oxidoreductase [Streptomyces sp. MST-110588]UNO38882.1 LLM class flavin-dependent oxidoreductase [Streptomyces sp. MST-110588]